MNKRTRLQAIMLMTGNSTSKDKVLASENIINKNIFNLNNYYDIYVDINNNWDTKSESRSLRRWLHTHIFLSDFTRAYAETKDDKYFIESFKLLTDWFEKFPIEERNSIDPLAYHDEGTAIRLLFWFKYYNEFKDLMNEEQISVFQEKIDEVGDLLFQDDFYAGLNNHGMFQDMGLIAYVLFKFENFEENKIFNKAMDRLVTYFKEVFTSEGIHKEHAPSYHVLLLHSLKQILQTLSKVDYSNDRLKTLQNIFRKGEQYTINITMPDFKLPNISDSTQVNMSTSGIYKNLFDSEEYRYITSASKEGKAPDKLINVYPESGYLVARNSWDRDAIYFLFLASYHMHYHKHTDDLSFILYKKGPIFIDAGPHSYNYKDPMTEYAYSQYAHSSLVVNDKSLPRTDFKFDKVYLTKEEIDEKNQTFETVAINERYEDVIHKRSICGDLKDESFNIKDIITSDKLNKYQLLFQVDGKLNVLKNGNILSIFKNNAKIAELECSKTEGIDSLDISVVNEQMEPRIMGYQFPKTEEKESSNTIVLEFYSVSKQVTVETIIRLKDFKITGSASFERRNDKKVYGEVSYIYERNNGLKLAIIFNSPDKEYKYPLETYNEVFKNKGYDLLYINDDQYKAGTSFIKGKSDSNIESDIESLIQKISNKYSYGNNDILLFGRSKSGFAALYYGLKNNYKNIFVITPLSYIGDYYSRHEEYKSLMQHLAGENEKGNRIYLNQYLFKINIEEYISDNNIYIGIGENDYHRDKHTLPIIEWLKLNSIDVYFHEFENIDYAGTTDYLKGNLENLLDYQNKKN